MKLLAALTILRIVPILAQTAPAFEVASVKPTAAEPGSSSGVATGKGRVTGRNVTLKRCIRSAYDVPESQVFGGPKWVDEDRYDIDAKAAGPAGDHDMMPMLRTLLAERFKLVFHRETRPLSGYALVGSKRGLSAKRSLPDTPSRSNSTRRSIEAEGCDMACLSRKLAEVLHVPVSDFNGSRRKIRFHIGICPGRPAGEAGRRGRRNRSGSVDLRGDRGATRSQARSAQGSHGSTGNRSRGKGVGKLTAANSTITKYSRQALRRDVK